MVTQMHSLLIFARRIIFNLKFLKFLILPFAILLLASCTNSEGDKANFSLGSIPYSIEIPKSIAKHLTLENLELDASNSFSSQAKEAGAVAQVRINYSAADGSLHGFANLYYFAKADFNKAQNPNEPPLYGSKVVDENGMVLAVAGPQDSIFEPTSEDGKNSMALNTLIYEPKSFKSS